MTPRGRHTEDAATEVSGPGSGVTTWTGEDWTGGDGQLTHPDSAFDDNLEEQLAKLAPRKIATRTTFVLASVVLLVAGFLAGAYTQRTYGASASTSGTDRGASARNGGGFPGGAFPSGAGRQPGARAGSAGGTNGTNTGGATIGKIKMIDGTTVYIETPAGQVIAVKTTDSTTVQTAQTSSVKDLGVGAQVTVEGATSGDAINATKITKTK